ncbi:MAG: DUF4271 domain-containing protein [Bacteroidaceae bacterium]|nr:DUF4271 domain-containing protein [Bacteroidaceae bacterium]
MNNLSLLQYTPSEDPLFVCLFTVCMVLFVPLLFFCSKRSLPWYLPLSLFGGLTLRYLLNDPSLLYISWLTVLSYYLYRTIMGRFINWIFFTHEKILQWEPSYRISLRVDYILFALFLSWHLFYAKPDMWSPSVLLHGLILCRIWLYFKSYPIFFSKISSCLHFFVYLCTLEVTPMLIISTLFSITE